MHAVRRTVADTTRRLIQRAYSQFWNERQLHAADRLFAENGEFSGLFGQSEPGPDGITDYAQRLFTALPDTRLHIEDLIVQRDRAAAKILLEGTHEGHLLDIAPTGRAIRLHCVALYRIGHGRIVQCEVIGNRDAVLRQIGAEPVLTSQPAGSRLQ
jgi:predicted ester cyclase